MTALTQILALGQTGAEPFQLATVTSTSPLQVRVDGADTAVSATIGDDNVVVGSRVIVIQVGRALHILDVLGTGRRGGHSIISGPWSASGQPSSTSGALFTVPRAGKYQCTLDLTGYVTATGVYTTSLWVDGSLVGSEPFYFNPTLTHLRTFPVVAELDLADGDHYYWIQFSGSSDANDKALFEWTLV